MNRTLRILLRVFAGLLISLSLGVLILFFLLPDPVKFFGRQKPAVAKAVPVPTPALPPPDSEVSPPPAQPPPVAVPVPAEAPPKPSDAGNFSFNTPEGREMFGYLLDDSQPMTEVCDNLGKRVDGDQNARFGASMRPNSPVKDPVVESFMPVLKSLFREPEVQELFAVIERAGAQETSSLIGKAEFYYQMVRAASALTAARPRYEKMLDRTYHLYMFSKAAELHPELLSDSAAIDYCYQIEDAVNDQTPWGASEERQAFSDFLASEGITAAEIGYDPKYETHLEVQRRNDSIQLSGGWLNDVMPK